MTAASGGLSAYGQYQQGVAANENAKRQYEYAIKQRALAWKQDLKIWNHKINVFEKQVKFNNQAANRSYEAEQNRLNEQFMQAAFQKQDMMVKLFKEQGMYGEVTGKSGNKLNQALLSQYGRNNATIAANLASARDATRTRQQDIRFQLRSANNQAYNNVGVKPVPGVAPPAPVLSNPGMGLAIGLGQAALGGINAGIGAMAPNPGGGGQYNFNPTPTGTGAVAPNGASYMGPAFGPSYVPYSWG